MSAYDTVGQLPIHPLFRSGIGKGVAEVLAKFHPELLIVSAVNWGNAI